MPDSDIQKANPWKGIVGDIVKLILFLSIGFFFVYWFLLKLEPSQKEDIWHSFTQANYFWVGLTMASVLLSHWVRAFRWQLLYKPLDCQPRLNNLFGSVIIAYMANLAFPRLGEVLRCATLHTSDSIPVEKSLGTVVAERCVDILAFGVVVLIGFLAMYGQARDWLVEVLSVKSSSYPDIALAVIASLAVLAFVVFLYRKYRQRLIRNKVFQKIDNILKGGICGLKSIFHLPTRSLLLFLLYSCIIYLFYILGGLFILQAFPETVGLGFEAAFVLYLFGSIGMTISQGGLGAYPVLVWQALALYGVSKPIGLATGWLLWSSQQVIVIIVGLIYLIYFSLVKRKNAPVSTTF